jgi:hypothetical protein
LTDVVSGELLSPVSLYLEPITEQQAQCIRLMVVEKLPQLVIARELGVSRETISRWKKAANFNAALQKAAGSALVMLEIECAQAQEGLVSLITDLTEYAGRALRGEGTVSGATIPDLAEVVAALKGLAEINALAAGRPTQISEQRTTAVQLTAAEMLAKMREEKKAQEGDLES